MYNIIIRYAENDAILCESALLDEDTASVLCEHSARASRNSRSQPCLRNRPKIR